MPTLIKLRASDESSTLKESTVKNLRKELTMQTNYRFSSQVFAKIFKNRMTEIHSTIHELATTYNLEPSSYCLFDSVFRQYNVKLNLEEFLTASTEKIQ